VHWTMAGGCVTRPAPRQKFFIVATVWGNICALRTLSRYASGRGVSHIEEWLAHHGLTGAFHILWIAVKGRV
jgi:hypothetical protein